MNNYNLGQYKENVYSQHGEDGMINHLLSLIPDPTNICVEFGTLDGVLFSNTLRFVQQKNYSAYYIEGDENFYSQLLETCKNNPTIKPIFAYVDYQGENTLDNILSNNGLIEKNFDILSIDVDGMDYKIWKNFVNYQPKIVIIETNSSLDMDMIMTEEELTDELLQKRGVNFGTMYKLGIEKGYTPVEYTGNFIFLKNEYLKYLV